MKIERTGLARILILIFLLQGVFYNGASLLIQENVKAAEDGIVYQMPNLQFTVGGTGEISTKQTDMRSLVNCEVGSYAECDINVPSAGSYNIIVDAKKYNQRGIFQLSVDGANQGDPQDLYSDKEIVHAKLNLGSKNFDKAGTKKFRFTVTGKNDASPVYTLSFYSIQLAAGTGGSEATVPATVAPSTTVAPKPSTATPKQKLAEKMAKAVVLYVGSSDAYVKNVKTGVDSTNVQIAPIVKDGRTLVPVRFVSESLGAKVDWDDATSTVIVTAGDKTIKLTIGQNIININGQENTLDVPAITENGRTLIPLRAMVEALGKGLFWDDRGLIVVSETAGLLDQNADRAVIDEAIKLFQNPISQAKKYLQDITTSADFKQTGITKDYYLDMMEKAVDAYPKKDVEDMVQKFSTAKLDDIQSYARLTSAIAVLIANGRKPDYRELWEKMMDQCCRDAGVLKGNQGNDFAVKEIMLAYEAMKDKISAQKREQWLSGMKKVGPANYKYYNSSKHNINVYNMAGEYLRQTEGLTDTADHFDKSWPGQLTLFDNNGMYNDQGAAPMLYDLTTRAQTEIILGNGYNGKYEAQLDEILQEGGLMTLFMQSSSYQLPYGGRSNQYQFNEALIAANCEYEANRYKKMGDMKTAGAFKRSAHLAVQSIKRWLDENPPKHIKNFYPTDSKFGTEDYGYYDKYMVTMANFIYIAYMFADDTIPETPCPAEVGGYVFQTSDTFHKVFANSNGHSIEIDTKADNHYDSTGLGRYHRSGVPTELALSIPFTAKPEYKLTQGLLTGNITISPGWDNGNGGKQYLSELSSGLNSSVKVIRQDEEQVSFSIEYTGTPFKGCKGVKEIYTLNKDGVQIQSDLIDPATNKIYYQVPLLVTNGKDVTEITQVQSQADVKMAGYQYMIQTDGTLTVDKAKYGNRNGEYNLAKVEKNDKAVTLNLKLY